MYRGRLRISEKGGTRNAWALGGVNVMLMSHLDFKLDEALNLESTFNSFLKKVLV